MRMMKRLAGVLAATVLATGLVATSTGAADAAPKDRGGDRISVLRTDTGWG